MQLIQEVTDKDYFCLWLKINLNLSMLLLGTEFVRIWNVPFVNETSCWYISLVKEK